MSKPSSHAAAKQKLGDLDRRYREILDTTDRIQDTGDDAAFDDFQPAVKARMGQIEQDLEDIRTGFPDLLDPLTEKYRAACRGQMFGAKSKWPKRGSSPESPSADDLLDFAFEEDLTLEGEPR